MDGIYFINDTKEHIRRVQLWLREISRSDERIKPVFIDGIYGDETREAVRNVQKVYGLAVTGELDKETFDLIFRLYSDQSIPARAFFRVDRENQHQCANGVFGVPYVDRVGVCPV